MAGGGEHLAGFGVDHGHLFAVADGEETVAGNIERQAGGGLAPGWPLGGKFAGMGVEADDFAFVFNVVKDGAVAIDGGEFRFAGQGDGGDDFLGGGVDHRGILAAAVESPDGLRGRLEDDAIRVGSGGDGGDDGEGVAIKSHDRVATAIGDVAEFAGGVEGHAVGAVEMTDHANLFTALGIEHVNVIAARDEKAMGGGVDLQVVPPAGVSQLPVVNHMVGLLRESGCGGKKGTEQGGGEGLFTKKLTVDLHRNLP